MRWGAFNWRSAIGCVILTAVVVLVMTALGLGRYATSALFGAVFTAASAATGKYRFVVARMIGYALIGAALTVLGFWVSGMAWGWVALSAFVVTLIAGLPARYGIRGLTNAVFLASWFLIALGLAAGYTAAGTPTPAWAQALAWLAGAAAWTVYITIGWLARGRPELAQRVPELPGDSTPIPLSRGMVVYAGIRALAVAASVAIASGLSLPDAQWMSIATLAAMKTDLAQTAARGTQRFIGATAGAVLALLLLLLIGDPVVLGLVIAILLALAVGTFTVNYALYAGFTAAAVLTALGIPDPANHTAELDRALFTLIGVVVGVLITLIANALTRPRRRTAGHTAR
jgi:hypothetical protein